MAVAMVTESHHMQYLFTCLLLAHSRSISIPFAANEGAMPPLIASLYPMPPIYTTLLLVMVGTSARVRGDAV